MKNSINNLLYKVLLEELDPEALLLLVPELVDTVGCQQNHPGHQFDVFTHSIKVVELMPMDLTLRLAALLHDIGKPYNKVLGKDGYDHFWGHEEVGAQKSETILIRLNIEKKQADTILQLIRLHDTPLARTLEEMQSAINKYSLDFISNLLILQRADLLAHSASYCAKKLPLWEEVNKLFDTMALGSH